MGAGHWLRGEAVLASRPPSLTTGFPEPPARGRLEGPPVGRRERRDLQLLAARGVGSLLRDPAREA